MSNTKVRLQDLTQEEIVALVEQNEHVYDDYCDENYTKSLEKNIFDYLNQHYFRSKFIGFDLATYPKRNNPDRPLIFISNHSGMAFPWDAMMFGSGLFKMQQHQFKRAARALAAPMLSMSTLMNPFLIPNFWKRVGGIDATSLNFETLMHFNRSNILIYPEGVPGIGKGFNRKYQLQRFSTSFVRMSLKYRTDVIPVLTINGEYINPYSYTVPWIDRLVQKIGVPFLPLSPITLLILVQPWLFYFAFPAKLIYVMGKRIKPYEIIDRPFEELSEQDISTVRDHIQQSMQADMDKAVATYGNTPFALKELLTDNLKNIHRIPFFAASGWPLLFAEHERLYRQGGGKEVNMQLGLFSIMGVIWRNPFFLWFFVPIIGWLPIILRGYANNQLDGKQYIRKI